MIRFRWVSCLEPINGGRSENIPNKLAGRSAFEVGYEMTHSYRAKMVFRLKLVLIPSLRGLFLCRCFAPHESSCYRQMKDSSLCAHCSLFCPSSLLISQPFFAKSQFYVCYISMASQVFMVCLFDSDFARDILI